MLRVQRYQLSHQKGDLDKSITHLTEATLLPGKNVELMFSGLAYILLQRFSDYQQPDDVKSSVKYFRFLRFDFRILDLGIRIRTYSSGLFRALAFSLELASEDMIRDMEEMMALIPEFITTESLAHPGEAFAIRAFAVAVGNIADTKMFSRMVTEQLAGRAIQVLRETTVFNPDLDISYALARCLAARFEVTRTISDHDEAVSIADKIVATHSPGVPLTETQRRAVMLIAVLLVSRLNSYSRPEYFEDMIHRVQTLLRLPCLSDQDRTHLKAVIDAFSERRFSYFGTTGTSAEPPLSIPPITSRSVVISRAPPLFPRQCVNQESDTLSTIQEKDNHLRKLSTAILNGEIAGRDVEAAVNRSRRLLTLQQSSDQWSFTLAHRFAEILVTAYKSTDFSTESLDYLNQAIIIYRDLRKMSALSGPKVICFEMGYFLSWPLVARCNLFRRSQDVEELMRLFLDLANDTSGEVYTRFTISCAWTWNARRYMHSSTSTAYDTTMSLLQETLVFSPTLQTQHLRLTHAFKENRGLPSDYASYQIENREFEKALETLERGRALLWSEMRGLRASADQLRAADPALADKFADINQRLESVTMSVAQREEIVDSETGTGHGCEGVNSIGSLVTTQRRLLVERETLISHIQSLPSFEGFLKPPSFDHLISAAAHGPVIIINQSDFSSHILLLLKGSPPSVISTPSDFDDRANRLKDELLRVRKENGLDSEEYNLALASSLADLYELVGKPVIERLHQLKVQEQSRVWWCPTGAFCSLPLHAMGPIPSDDGNELYFSDLYIPSYTPTLSALIESRKPGSYSETSDDWKPKPSLVLVAQPDTLPGAWGEIEVIQTTKTAVTSLVSAMAIPKTVVDHLRDHQFAHFICHGLLEIGRPFDAAFELHGGKLTLLDIVRSRLPAAEFAFLAACHTAELTEGSVDDEGLHLAAAMQFCGFRSVVGTMWAMIDTDGADLSKDFYKAIFSDKDDQIGVPYYERSARALQTAVKKLRKKRGITLERWVNFVHYGA